MIDRALLDVTSTSTGRTFTVSANIPNPHFTGMGQKYGTNDNINFIVPGSLLPAGSYSFRARLFNGPEVISTVNFGGNTYSFTRTQDVRILVVLPDYLAYERTPDELGLLFDYLDDVARALPIRNGWGIPGDDAGLQVTLRPFEPVCDGTFPSPFPNCGPSQTEVDSDVSARFKWRLVQDRASGQLRTQMPSFVTDSVPCPGRNTLSYLDDGSGNLRTVLVPGTFLYFPGFLPNTADPTFDLNYDGRLDATDLAPYVAEFFNGRTGAWSQDLSQLRPGDIVHNFVDSNTDPTLNRNCVFNTGEQQAPFTEGMLVSWMIQKARVLADAANVRFGAYAIWPGMDQAGTAGGTSYGDTFWAVLKPWPTFHHELGHGFGLVSSQAPNFDGCCHSRNFNVNDPRGFNVIRGISLGSANSIMSGQGISPPYYGSMFEAVDYTSIFNQLRESPLSSGRSTGGDASFSDAVPAQCLRGQTGSFSTD